MDPFQFRVITGMLGIIIVELFFVVATLFLGRGIDGHKNEEEI